LHTTRRGARDSPRGPQPPFLSSPTYQSMYNLPKAHTTRRRPTLRLSLPTSQSPTRPRDPPSPSPPPPSAIHCRPRRNIHPKVRGGFPTVDTGVDQRMFCRNHSTLRRTKDSAELPPGRLSSLRCLRIQTVPHLLAQERGTPERRNHHVLHFGREQYLAPAVRGL